MNQFLYDNKDDLFDLLNKNAATINSHKRKMLPLGISTLLMAAVAIGVSVFSFAPAIIISVLAAINFVPLAVLAFKSNKLSAENHEIKEALEQRKIPVHSLNLSKKDKIEQQDLPTGKKGHQQELANLH